LCGILYLKSNNGQPVGKYAEIVYQYQKNRGQNGWGMVEVKKDKITVSRFTKENDAVKALKESNAPEILFHNRFPTSTNNTVKTNHPIVSINPAYKHNYYFIHNGIIGNDLQLKIDHEKLGIKYNTVEDYRFNDSESLMHELILIIEGIKKPEEFAAKGSLAFIMLQTDKTDHAEALYYGRWGNPLKFTNIKGMMVLRSECPKTEDIEENKLFRYDYKKKTITCQDIMFGERVKLLQLPQNKKQPKKIDTDITKFTEVIKLLYGHQYINETLLKNIGRNEMALLLVAARKIKRELQLQMESAIINNKDISDEIWPKIHYDRAVFNLSTINDFIKE